MHCGLVLQGAERAPKAATMRPSAAILASAMTAGRAQRLLGKAACLLAVAYLRVATIRSPLASEQPGEMP
jgi:hypothetical protein